MTVACQPADSMHTVMLGSCLLPCPDQRMWAVRALLHCVCCDVCCRVQGVPCVQAVGEAEAMCAALNVCGWAHAVHTADVDALLFGALTVYSKMHLQASHLAVSWQPHMLHSQFEQARPGSSCDCMF